MLTINMFSFSIGTLSFIFSGVFTALYLTQYVVRLIGAWLKRGEPPKDRVLAIVVIFALVGFGIGSFAQPKWGDFSTCRENGKSVASCIFSINV